MGGKSPCNQVAASDETSLRSSPHRSGAPFALTFLADCDRQKFPHFGSSTAPKASTSASPGPVPDAEMLGPCESTGLVFDNPLLE